MVSLSKVAALVFVAAAACLFTTPLYASEHGPANSRSLSSVCPLHVREILPNESLASTDILAPDDVERLRPVKSIYANGLAFVVDLTPSAAARMLAYSTAHKYGSIAFLCGEHRVSRAAIAAPFGSGFRVELKAGAAPNNSSKPTPLRGAA